MADLQRMNSNDFGWRLVDLIENQGCCMDVVLALIDGAEVRPSLEEVLAATGLTRDELVGMLAMMEARQAGPGADFARLIGFDIDVSARLHQHAETGKWSWRFHPKPGLPGAAYG